MTRSAGGSFGDDGDLNARITALEAENGRLTAIADAVDHAPLGSRAAQTRATGRWRAFLSALCIVIAAVLVPVSIVGAWARAELVDPDRFVSTFGPLVRDSAVQGMLIDEVTEAALEQVDVSSLTNDLFDGLAVLDLPPRALVALDLLRVPAAQGAQGLIEQATTRVVESDAFADVWNTALRASHRGLVAAATGGTEGVVTINGEGVIGIQLAPIIAEVKQRLTSEGVGLAAAIPVVDRTIVIAQSDTLVTVRVVYGLAVTVGWWLPLVSLFFFVAAVLIARRKSTALLGAGLGLAFGGATLAAGLGIGGTVLGLSASNLGVPSAAMAAIYEQVIADMRQTAIVATVVGAIIALLAWFRGRWRGAVAARSAIEAVNSAIRGTVVGRGAGAASGSFGVWMNRQRVLVRASIATLAVVWLWFMRPLGVGEIFAALISALFVWWICELVRRTDVELPAETAPAAPAAAAAADSVEAEQL